MFVDKESACLSFKNWGWRIWKMDASSRISCAISVWLERKNPPQNTNFCMGPWEGNHGERSYKENFLICLPSWCIICRWEDGTINHLFFPCNSASLFEYIFDALFKENLFIFGKAMALWMWFLLCCGWFGKKEIAISLKGKERNANSLWNKFPLFYSLGLPKNIFETILSFWLISIEKG